MYNNPFPYSNDNKRYYTISYYFKEKYHQKVAKVPLNAGFTCPNRDGSKSVGGCTFCSSKGSGDSILDFQESLEHQYEVGLERMRHKWPDCLGFAYFQSYTNTYAPLSKLKEIYDPFFNREDVTGIAIATRADCLKEDVIQYLEEQAKKKETWIELGLQSIHEKTMQACNRAHTTQELYDTLDRLANTSIHVCVHIMNGLPGESKEDMLETVIQLSKHKFDAIKIHMLHIIEGTKMAEQYKDTNFPLFSIEEYVDVVVDQLELLPPTCVIERVTGDGLAKDLIAPLWTIKKTIVANEIDKRMVKKDTWQGKKFGN
ncbi:MAG: TIGR01212 family radical SAM protein [Firmicutes bacterium]|nr:TIGR01212 family radical SAM protein [Bacillota bacterium]